MLSQDIYPRAETPDLYKMSRNNSVPRIPNDISPCIQQSHSDLVAILPPHPGLEVYWGRGPRVPLRSTRGYDSPARFAGAGVSTS
jgi:hypothetical protein